MLSVYDFFIGADNVPLSTKVNLYDFRTGKKIVENYQDLRTVVFDDLLYVRHIYKPKSKLLMIYCSL